MRQILDRGRAAATPASGSGSPSANGGIVAASNDALAMAEGEFVALLDHDDTLHPDALAHVAEALDGPPTPTTSTPTRTRSTPTGATRGPFFKPDWSPERMRTQMYTCHLSVLRRTLVEEVGGFDPEFEGSQDWDLVLKVTERARAVVHVPRILYHWRMLETSAAGGGEAAKPYAFEAGSGRSRPTATGSGCRPRSSATPRTPASSTSTRDSSERAAGQHRHPHRRPACAKSASSRSCWSSNCVRSIVEHSTY